MVAPCKAGHAKEKSVTALMVKMPMMMIMMKRAMMMMEEMMVAPGKAGHAEEEGDGEEDVRHKAE